MARPALPDRPTLLARPFVHAGCWETTSRLPFPADEVLAWHLRPGALERLLPPFAPVRLLAGDPKVAEGSRVTLRVGAGPLSLRWVAEHRDVGVHGSFTDVQVRGPFRRWEHTHAVEDDGPLACRLHERIVYELPGGALGRRLGEGPLHRRLQTAFAWRHERTARDLRRHAEAGVRGLRVAVTGSSGFIGSQLVPFLTTGGHSVLRVVRRAAAAPDEVAWEGAPRLGDLAALDGLDAVVHLQGEPVAARWTRSRKQAIHDSRVHGTAALVAALAALPRPPAAFVCASAVGIYGHRGDEELTERSAPGTGFLATTARAWEAAAEPLRARGTRVVSARLGVVLDPRGGALARLLPPFRLGLGGPLGDGRQWLPWVALEDAVAALAAALVRDDLDGPVNVVAPEPVRFEELAATLGRVLRRPARLPFPAPAARLLFGEMAGELLLASQRVRPAALVAAGFRFDEPRLEGALRALLGRPS